MVNSTPYFNKTLKIKRFSLVCSYLPVTSSVVMLVTVKSSILSSGTCWGFSFTGVIVYDRSFAAFFFLYGSNVDAAPQPAHFCKWAGVTGCTRKWTCVINTEPKGGGGILHTCSLNCYHVHITRRRLLKTCEWTERWSVLANVIQRGWNSFVMSL